jgi:ribosomal protein L31
MSAQNQPEYRPVVFRDRSAGFAFLTRSTAVSERTIEWDDGKSYPVVDVEISSKSHPFYTGRARPVDAEGEIAKFERRYGTSGADERGDTVPATASGTTPDNLLHTGTDGPLDAEDLVLASGRDLTPENLAWAERRLAEEGRAAVDKELP